MDSTTKDRDSSWWPSLEGNSKSDSATPLFTTAQIKEAAVALESTNNQYHMNDKVQLMNYGKPSSLQETTVYNYTAPSIELRVDQANDTSIFIIQESRISKFVSLNKLIEASRRTEPQSDNPVIVVNGDSGIASDFKNTFDLLDASPVELIDFNPEILASAARISAAYDYPSLHAFCIRKLEELPLGPIERLRIGCALGLRSWEERVYQELSEREEMITEEEMLTLGTTAYFQVASTRERRQKNEISQLSSGFRLRPTIASGGTHQSEKLVEDRSVDRPPTNTSQPSPPKPMSLSVPSKPISPPLPSKPASLPPPSKLVDKPAHKPIDRPTERSTERPREMPTERPREMPTESIYY